MGQKVAILKAKPRRVIFNPGSENSDLQKELQQAGIHVLEGADYVQESNVTQGRSWGCPAVAMENRTKLIDLVKGGSIIYATK